MTTALIAAAQTTLSIGSWNSDGIDAAGVAWTLTQLTGWWEPPGVKDLSVQRPIGPGAFDGPVFDDVRVIGVTVRFSAPSPYALHQALLTVGTVRAALMQGTTIVGHQPDGDYTVTGRTAQGWLVAPHGPLGFEYQFSITCRDPYKYGPEVQASTGLPAAGGSLLFPLWSTGRVSMDFGAPGPSGQVTLSNPGTVAAWPLFVVQGPLLGGFTLSDIGSGSLLQFADDTPSGATVVLDASTGRAWLNGQDRTGSLTSAQWWPVPAQGASTVQFNAVLNGQSGTLTAQMQPAYY